MTDWEALHVFYHNIPKYDDLISMVTKLYDGYRKKGELDKWFFIRYWEGGPHIRFRMLNIADEKIHEVKEAIRKFIEDNPSAYVFSKEEYYKDNKLDGEPMDITTLPWYEEGNIVNIPYVKEIQRYGGKDVMEFSETIFCYSSYIAKSIIESTKNNFNKKLLFAEALTYIEAKEFRKVYEKDDTRDFLAVYKKNWKSFLYNTENETKIEDFFSINSRAIKRAVDILYRNDEFMRLIYLIKDEIAKIAEKVKEARYMDYIMASHIHMTNNRLGAAPVYEYFISNNLISLVEEM